MMSYKKNVIVLSFCVVNLCSCMVEDNEGYTPSYTTYTYDNSQLYPPVNVNQYNSTYKYSEQVTVPDSYHVGEFHSPVSFKDRDKNWVSGQNPQSYTIEIAEGEKAAEVAQKLYKAPKTDRMAQVKLNSNGKSYYKGVYGTYPDADSAQKALNALPNDIKQGASVKNWSSVQQNLE